MQRYRAPVTIDEIQYAPELLPYTMLAVDADKRPGQFWLTGSQQFHLMKEVSESLAGRVAIMTKLGLARREADQADAMLPPFLPTPDHLARRFDTMDSLPLPLLYERIWRACAARTAQILNIADLARDTGVAPNTAKSWLSILQTSGLIHLLEPYHTNVTKRLIKRPKLYFLDTGLCAWLTEWTSPATLEAGAASGAILETWILTELLKSWWHAGKRAPFYFYRDREKREIDLLIAQDAALHPLDF